MARQTFNYASKDNLQKDVNDLNSDFAQNSNDYWAFDEGSMKVNNGRIGTSEYRYIRASNLKKPYPSGNPHPAYTDRADIESLKGNIYGSDHLEQHNTPGLQAQIPKHVNLQENEESVIKFMAVLVNSTVIPKSHNKWSLNNLKFAQRILYPQMSREQKLEFLSEFVDKGTKEYVSQQHQGERDKQRDSQVAQGGGANQGVTLDPRSFWRAITASYIDPHLFATEQGPWLMICFANLGDPLSIKDDLFRRIMHPYAWQAMKENNVKIGETEFVYIYNVVRNRYANSYDDVEVDLNFPSLYYQSCLDERFNEIPENFDNLYDVGAILAPKQKLQ